MLFPIADVVVNPGLLVLLGPDRGHSQRLFPALGEAF